jgi:glycosyltransferase involved in cell wall biosynthesis
LHLHGTDIRDFNHESIKGALVLKGIRKAKAVFYSTPDLYKIIKPIRSDAIYLPNPINTDIFSPHITFSKNDQIDIFNISKLDKNKGIEKQFLILENILNQKHDLMIAIFNFGNIAEEYADKLNKFYRSKSVKIFGKVQHRDMIDIINNSRIILGQMSIGSLGCSELEAMACGKPVVCHISDLEMYPTPPPVISVSNTIEAEERILELLRNPNLAYEIGKKSRKWVEENHDYVIIAKKLLSYYQQDIK